MTRSPRIGYSYRAPDVVCLHYKTSEQCAARAQTMGLDTIAKWGRVVHLQRYNPRFGNAFKISQCANRSTTHCHEECFDKTRLYKTKNCWFGAKKNVAIMGLMEPSTDLKLKHFCMIKIGH